MKKIKRAEKNVRNYFYDHPGQKDFLQILFVILCISLSSVAFAVSINIFVSPNLDALVLNGVDIGEGTIRRLSSTGFSGISQSILFILRFFPIEFLKSGDAWTISYWVIYFILNLPLMIFAFFKIGKRFGIYTFIHIALACFLGAVLVSNDPNYFINRFAALFYDQPLTRVIFGGVISGASSGLCYLIGCCAGGTDIPIFYLSEKKNILAGKYTTIFNLIIVILFAILSTYPANPIYNEEPTDIYSAVIVFMYTLIYIVVLSFSVDKVNNSNVKVELQIITKDKNLSNVLLAMTPHGCTILNGKGGYSFEDKIILLISIRKRELNKVIQIIKEEDPSAFIDIILLDNVVGNFFKRKVK